MKRYVSRWVNGAKGFDRKWTKVKIYQASLALLYLGKQMPREIHRSIRSLDVLKYWKGVEFRTLLLLYTGIVVFEHFLPDDKYKLFRMLFCAVTICSCNIYKNFIPIASKIFGSYIRGYIRIYGRHSITSNIHNLAHVTEDMLHQNIGNLMDISTYKYENCLRLIGLKVKSCRSPLEQAAKRIMETEGIERALNSESLFELEEFTPVLKYKIRNPLNSTNAIYRHIEISPDIVLSNKTIGDCWFLTHSGHIVKMIHAMKIENVFKVCGTRILQKQLFFKDPIAFSVNSTFSVLMVIFRMSI